jgi:hypothetical protein
MSRYGYPMLLHLTFGDRIAMLTPGHVIEMQLKKSDGLRGVRDV